MFTNFDKPKLDQHCGQGDKPNSVSYHFSRLCKVSQRQTFVIFYTFQATTPLSNRTGDWKPAHTVKHSGMLHNEGGLQFSDNNTSISSYQGHMGSKTLH